MNYLVYKHTSPSGKAYIGITNDYDRRCAEHKRNKKNHPFTNAIRKYGWDNFLHEILYDNLTEYDAKSREEQTINEYGSKFPYGYNLSSGGSRNDGLSGIPKSEAHKQALSKAAKGKQKSAAHKQLISSIRTGTRHTQASRDKMSLNNRKYRYCITGPDGTCYITTSLNKFCIEHNLSCGTMSEVVRGLRPSLKGWSGYIIHSI